MARPLALVAVAVLALHELLRCLLGSFGPGGASGIGFPWLLAYLGVILLASRLLRARISGVAPRPTSIGGLSLKRQAALWAIAIAGLYLVEAVAEGVVFAGTVDGLGVFGPGGLCVLPLAIALAPLCLLADRWFGRLEVSAAGARRQPSGRPFQAPLRVQLDSGPTGAGISPLAFGLARRPPPLSFG